MILNKMWLILVISFVFINSVTCVEENNKSTLLSEQKRYSFNHPPSAEDYNPIPVAVVYEDDVIAEKSTSKGASKARSDSNAEKVNNEKEEPTTELPNPDSDYYTTGIIFMKPKARALNELQIPVAVMYDSIPDQRPASAENIKPKRKLKQRRRRVQSKISKNNTVNENLQKIVELNTSEKQSVDPIKRTEYIKPQIGKVDPVMEIPKVKTIIEPRKGGRDPVTPIISSDNYVFSHSGNFHYSYEGGDGTKAFSEGHQLRNEDNKATGEAVSGGFSYTDKEGNDFSISYTADENGYRPVGAHLPTPPPIPPAIARALAYLATATTPEPVTKPSIKKAKQ